MTWIFKAGITTDVITIINGECMPMALSPVISTEGSGLVCTPGYETHRVADMHESFFWHDKPIGSNTPSFTTSVPMYITIFICKNQIAIRLHPEDLFLASITERASAPDMPWMIIFILVITVSVQDQISIIL